MDPEDVKPKPRRPPRAAQTLKTASSGVGGGDSTSYLVSPTADARQRPTTIWGRQEDVETPPVASDDFSSSTDDLTKPVGKPLGDGRVVAMSALISQKVARLRPVPDEHGRKWTDMCLNPKRYLNRRSRRFKALYACGCFLIFAIILLLVILAIIWRGPPWTEVLGVLPSQQGEGVKFDLGLTRQFSINPSVTLNMTIDTRVHNENLVNLMMEKVDVSVYHPKVPKLRLARTILKNIYLPQSSVVPVPLKLLFYFALVSDPSGEIMNDFIAACTRNPDTNLPDKQVELYAKTIATGRLLPTSIRQTMTLEAWPAFDCPVLNDRIIRLFGIPFRLDKIDWAAASRGELVYKDAPKELADLITALKTGQKSQQEIDRAFEDFSRGFEVIKQSDQVTGLDLGGGSGGLPPNPFAQTAPNVVSPPPVVPVPAPTPAPSTPPPPADPAPAPGT